MLATKTFVTCALYSMFMAMAAVTAQETEEQPAPDDETAEIEGMTADQLEEIVGKLDEEYTRSDGVIEFSYAELAITVVTDPNADRMRIVIPIVEAEDISRELLFRILQANFDSALDARYAVGQNILWSTFIHRLSTLTPEDFLSGVGQAINIVLTFGTTFSSGALIYGGGDSGEMHRELIEELLKKGQTV